MTRIPDPPGDWVESAACAGTNPDIFFPERGDTGERAKTICRRCPVIDECRAWILEDGNDLGHGVFGGMTPRDRRTLRRERSGRQLPPIRNHGTEAGWTAHRRRGEDPCAECETEKQAAARARRRRNRKASR